MIAKLAQYLDPRNEPVMTLYVLGQFARLAGYFGLELDHLALQPEVEPYVAWAFLWVRSRVVPVRNLPATDHYGF